MPLEDAIWNYDARNYSSYLLRSGGVYDRQWVMQHTAILHFCGREKPWKPGIFTALGFCISIICSWRAGRGRFACNRRRPKGDGSRWNEIYELNRSIIQDYNLIYIGQVFKLPKV